MFYRWFRLISILWVYLPCPAVSTLALFFDRAILDWIIEFAISCKGRSCLVPRVSVHSGDSSRLLNWLDKRSSTGGPGGSLTQSGRSWWGRMASRWGRSCAPGLRTSPHITLGLHVAYVVGTTFEKDTVYNCYHWLKPAHYIHITVIIWLWHSYNYDLNI